MKCIFAECCETQRENSVLSESVKTDCFEITDDEVNTSLLGAAWPRSRFCTPWSWEWERGGYANKRRQKTKGESVSRDVWQWCVAEEFSAQWSPEAAPRLDKYIVEFNILTFFRGCIGQWYARKDARRTQKPGTKVLEYQELQK